MATQVRDKYYLRSLHEEIGLFDRKLAHLLKHEPFASEQERDAAAGKLSAKREQLVRAARQMADEGIEFKNSELPRSLSPEDSRPEDQAVAAPAEPAAEVALARPRRQSAAAHDGTVLDFREGIKAYIEKRRKTPPANPEA
jgi:hypothetical protein